MKTNAFFSLLSAAAVLTGTAVGGQSTHPSPQNPAVGPAETANGLESSLRVERIPGNTSAGMTRGSPGTVAAGSHESLGTRRARFNQEVDLPTYGIAGVGVSATADAEPTLRAIQSGTFASRDQLLAQVDQRLEVTADTVEALKREARRLDAGARSEFKIAIRDVEEQEKMLKRSLKAARSADADSWESARMNVATAYSSYANAVARAQMTAAAPGTALNAR